MRLCDRMAQGEDADALARDTLEAALRACGRCRAHTFRISRSLPKRNAVMIRTSRLLLLGAATIPAALVSAACSGAKTSAAALSEPAAVAVRAVAVQR